MKLNPISEGDTQKEKGLSISEAILEGTHVLRNAGVPEARRDAGSLLAHVLDHDHTFIISHADELVDPAAVKNFAEYLQRRAQGEPMQYIIGCQEFFGLTFEVTSDVLIPRPETELLVEAALSVVNSNLDRSLLICDVGTGSGCISVALLKTCPNARAIGIDISEAATRIAQKNAARHQVNQRLPLVVSDCFAAFDETMASFDLILSNPPYVSADALTGLQREVRDYEPLLALTPGIDGLVFIRRLLNESANYLRPGGHLLFEIGFDQGAAVQELINDRVWQLVQIQQDLQGIPRVVALRKISA